MTSRTRAYTADRWSATKFHFKALDKAAKNHRYLCGMQNAAPPNFGAETSTTDHHLHMTPCGVINRSPPASVSQRPLGTDD